MIIAILQDEKIILVDYIRGDADYSNINSVYPTLITTDLIQENLADFSHVPSYHLKNTDGVISEMSTEEKLALGDTFIQTLREKEYKQFCDPLLNIMYAYEKSGETEKYNTIKDEWDAKRLEIQTKYPYNS